MSSAGQPLQATVKALTFDVFGTVVDWRSSVEAELNKVVKKKTTSPEFQSLSPETSERVKALTEQDWATFAQQWRDSYKKFTRGFVPGETPWKDIDTHHYDSLVELLDKWKLQDLYSEDEIKDLSLVWHRLTPWSDSSEGIHTLGTAFITSTLSNGNRSLLKDLNDFGNLGFQKLTSAEDFSAYKPSPAVYLGAAKSFGVKPEEVAMVAAHLNDLQAAKSLGLRTIYVERLSEEDWEEDDPRFQEARKWVDIWVSQDEAGFVTVAQKLGLPRD